VSDAEITLRLAADLLHKLAEMQTRFAQTDADVREALQASAVARERYRAAQERRRRRRWFC
jgi:hypothetical protein